MSRGSGDRFARRRRAVRLGRLRWLWVSLAAAMVAAGVGWVVLFSSWLGVDGVAVSGERTVAASKVRDAAAVVEGTPLARVDTEAVAGRVERIRAVEGVTVDRAWPGTLRVQVHEREAIAVVTADGTKRALDENGVLFKKVDKVPEHMPRVTVTAQGADRPDALAEVAAVVAALDAKIARKVEHVEAASMDAIVLELRNGADVRWGSAQKDDRKARVLTTLLEREAETYDVSVPERPTTES